MKDIRKQQRKKRTRGKMQGTAKRPRLSVFRSNNHMYAQLIDDKEHTTLLGVADTIIANEPKMGKIARAKSLGLELAKMAQEKKIKKVIFDKGSYAYHGRVKAVAEGAREGGLQL